MKKVDTYFPASFIYKQIMLLAGWLLNFFDHTSEAQCLSVAFRIIQDPIVYFFLSYLLKNINFFNVKLEE